MKTCLIVLFALIGLVFQGYAQRKIDDYHSVYFEKDFTISATQSKTDNTQFNYYISVPSADDNKVSMILASARLPEFIDYLTLLRATYTKWNQTAKDNNVTELEKQIEAKPFSCEAGFIYGDWHFDFSVDLTPRVKIVDGKMLLIIRSDELEASSNEFIKQKGFYYVFTSPTEINQFIAKLDLSKVRAVFTQKAKTEELFKN